MIRSLTGMFANGHTNVAFTVLSTKPISCSIPQFTRLVAIEGYCTLSIE